MNEIQFEVQGSAENPYQVVFVRRSERNLSAYCSCPAGENGQYCKHRINILAGVIDGLVSSNEGDVKVVQSWLVGTDIDAAIKKMQALQLEADRIKNSLSAAKKDVAKAMRD